MHPSVIQTGWVSMKRILAGLFGIALIFALASGAAYKSSISIFDGFDIKRYETIDVPISQGLDGKSSLYLLPWFRPVHLQDVS